MMNSHRFARAARLMTGCVAVASAAVLLGGATAGAEAAAAAVQSRGSAAQARAAAAVQSRGSAAQARPAAAVQSSGSATRVQAGKLAAAPRLPFGDHPAGFWYGTDSSPISISGPPYREPVIGGNYGGYIGMTGKWSQWLGCKVSPLAWSSANSQEANANFAHHLGIGTGVYWFMGGPGVDPNYNGSTSEAYAWGQRQAARTLWDIGGEHVTYPVVFMDVELPGVGPAPDNGWDSVYTSPCSGRVRINHISTAVDRADFNGFAAYLTSHSTYKAGVYSAALVWNTIFGTGADSLIPNTYEWTYTGNTSSLSHVPNGWCLKSTTTCAHFFGGQSRGGTYALMWQWSGGGGTFNGHGDFDQIDANLTP